jgi:hypothetical protein
MTANKATETENQPEPQNTGGWKGTIFNICFTLYYYLVYKLMIDETTFVQSYGIGSGILFSKTLALIILLSLLSEPFAIFYKLNYENYSVKGRALRLPGFYLFIMLVSRFFVRLIFVIALLESLNMEVKNGGTGAMLIATLLLVIEIVFVIAIADKSFVGKVRPALAREIFTRFILLNMLVFFTFLFRSLFGYIFKGHEHSLMWKIVIGLVLFLTMYLPNTMVQFYADWRAAKTPMQKSLYLLSLGAVFLGIILF